MSNSYRIRTTPGVDKSIKIRIDQEFEYLEILSLKLLQSQVYTRQCSDYGVIVGRVSINNGFGVPNAKVSIFIPLTSDDEINNPIIADLYPYKTLTQVNDLGYRYNLLPQEPSYSNHVPTGSFFTKDDVLTNPTKIEIYDKYFKYNAVTNESGDYMIFGVPIGIQTLVVNVDLSDIGEFSLSPQDMVRMGLASETEVSGTKFKSSSNLNELPQIITINRTLEVEPLWGEPDICNLGITRTDFDLSAEKNINILPTAIFMGSIFSTNDDSYQKKNCKPSLNSGELCDLIAGPGEILAIRQTINIDSLGRPALEEYRLESGGQVIDENGTWLVDVPMNLDYVVTNEFGESVISNDKTKGIPTKGKYRFKIKWNQTPTLADPIKRGYFLAPNVKEYGWVGNTDPLTQGTGTNNAAAKSSYAFSLDWNDYGPTGTTIGDTMVQEAINCEDKFYDMTYNKVYTISQLITQYRKGVANTRFISIKNILDDSCRSENNKFPTNDAYYRLDIIYLLFTIASFLFRPILFVLIVLMHMIAFILSYLMIPLLLAFATYATFKIINLVASIVACFPSVGLAIPFAAEILAWIGMVVLLGVLTVKSNKIKKIFKNVKIPVLTYPDCEFCTCNNPSDASEEENDATLDTGKSENSNVIPINKKGTALLSPINNLGLYQQDSNYHNNEPQINGLLAGQQIPSTGGSLGAVGTGILGNDAGYGRQLPQYEYSFTDSSDDGEQVTQLWQAFTNDIPLPERLNLFNTKAKYFNQSGNNPGGGVNKIKVTFGSDLNNPNTFYHYDNVIAILVTPDVAASINAGQLMTFQDSTLSGDINTKLGPINIYGTNQVTGTSILQSATTTNVNVTWADPANPGANKTTPYLLTGDTTNNNGVLYKYRADVEYFQVIKKTTVKDFIAKSSSSTPNTLYQRVFGRETYVYNVRRFKKDVTCGSIERTNMRYGNYDKEGKQVLLFLVRGVDPNSPKVQVRYDLSTIYGLPDNTIVEGEPYTTSSGKKIKPLFKLNIPIQGGFKNVDHSNIGNNNQVDSYSGMKLFYPSYHFIPGSDMSGFTTNLPQYYSSLNLSTNQVFSMTNPNNNYIYKNPTYLGTNEGHDYPGSNRGNYFPGENVEGGSYLHNTSTKQDCPTFKNVKKKPWLTNSYYLSPRYSGSWSVVKSTPTVNNIVMRSDRLPTSTFDYSPAGTGNYLPLHSNPGFEVFLIDDEGGSASGSVSTGTANGGSEDSEIKLDGSTSSMSQDVLDSFNCKSLVPLTCYDYNSSTNKIEIKPSGNECYNNQTRFEDSIMENGCYIFVTAIFLSLGRDFELLSEWVARINVNFAACRNVFAHSFVNNWVNGSLFAFSFKNNRYFDKQNQPFSEYCTDTVYLNTDTSNFYYRSSPYNYLNNSFVGKTANTKGIGNKKNLLFPTTIMDLGPRSSYMQEISFSDNYDGYVLNKLNSTTFNDVSELLNYFLITRIANNSVFGEVSSINVLSFFNRKQNGSFVRMIDGDYAQMISINSELGVTPFDESTYDGDSVFYFGAESPNAAFGVFYSSNTQTRDWVSPRRTIINGDVSLLSTCSFSNLPVKTQTVPFYQWFVKPNDKTKTIFGTQENEWYTDLIDNGSFFSNGYQSMDRLLKTSRYYRTKNASKTNYFKGFLYGVDNSGGLNPSDSNWETNDGNESRAITVGAPYHFYFGLKKGKSAFDRLTTKWIDTDNITD